jgi:hypothetical protein
MVFERKSRRHVHTYVLTDFFSQQINIIKLATRAAGLRKDIRRILEVFNITIKNKG